MTVHKIGTREEWLLARLQLLEVEKELTRRSNELEQWRQRLLWVQIDKEYRFETYEGQANFANLFRGRSQLLVYHFLFGPKYAGVDRIATSILSDRLNDNQDESLVGMVGQYNITGPGSAWGSSIAAVSRGQNKLDVWWIGLLGQSEREKLPYEQSGAVYWNSWDYGDTPPSGRYDMP